ncbi:MAG TPA: 30S ribosomal protein THX [Candidatus Omnitrophota bacterium]|jgi:ribosomal small subunit protein bTHX|nr:30S ribosomal protein THX [Candidatus Omnitrophota bacterium]HPN56886.1 30S ribosomal protein THX [Candidatus Omnitrophota bacterium]
MGKGDPKTKRGKIVAGTHGKTRSRKKEKQKRLKKAPVAKKT